MRLAKRLFDLAAATLGIILLSPLFLLLALLIKLDDRGPVFFRQVRVGYRGKPFRIWKFRSMVVNASKLGGALTVGRDPRITRVGYWLRKFKLDELPQLFNVFLGEMSFVGPRPEVAKYVALYTPEQRGVLELMPGITDLASIKYRNENEVLAKSPDPERTYIEEVMPEKIRINLEYARQASIGSDLMVILQTLVRLWR
jgi:lipopolysaccharide/colanic/teichoic acid biosynthesis glycosyltransferase